MAKTSLVSRIRYQVLGIKNQVLRIKKWMGKNPTETGILVIILLAGAFFRLYKIGDYMTFLGDEGRDAMIIRKFLVNFDLMLIGPRTSIGDMYLGPLYYYLMAPALLLANFSPVGPAVMVALVSVITILFIWLVAREWFGMVAAWTSALLYALSPVVIIYSRSSWNPNIMPFFAFLAIYAIWKVWEGNNQKWLVVCAISFAFMLQSHYLGLLLAPLLAFVFFLSFIKWYGLNNLKRGVFPNIFFKKTAGAIVIFLFLMSPLVIFDARHGWRNFAAINKFFTQRQTTISAKLWKALPNIWPIFKENVVTRIVAGTDIFAGKITSWIMLTGGVGVFLIYLPKIKGVFAQQLIKNKEINFASGYFHIIVWILTGLTGMGLYKQHIYDHYFGFMFPALFLLLGAIFQKVYSSFGNDGKIFVTAGVLTLSLVNLGKNPLWYEPNYQMTRAIEVAKKIQEEAGGERFNLAVIAERNYEDGYQYFLEKEEAKIVEIDPQVPSTITKQLFVVCEISDERCDPTHSPKAEIANFGWSRIEGKWGIVGVTLFKLVHTN